MSKSPESEIDSGAKRSSVDVVPTPELTAAMIASVVTRVGGIASTALLGELADLRKAPDRVQLIDQLASDIRPEGVSVNLWVDWLTGGRAPLDANALQRPVASKESAGRLLSRAALHTSVADKKVAAAKDKIAKAEAELAAATQEALVIRATEAACLQWAAGQQLLSYMSEVFAMGPAWTILRSISSFISISEEEVEKMPKSQREAYDERAKERTKETDDLLVGLDFFCGDRRFETAIRMAILKVIEDFAYTRREMEEEGAKPRSVRQLRKSARSDGSDMKQVFSGLPTS